MKQFITYIILLVFGLPNFGWSQDSTYKERKSITFTETYKEGDKIFIYGERTFVNIRTWTRDVVSLKADVISRYKQKSQAEKDLEKIQLSFKKSGKKIIYNNTIRIANPSDKPLSNLKVNVELFVPENAEVIIENHFGEVEVSGILDELSITSDFTKINISETEANCQIETSYGDVAVSNSAINLVVIADRSNLNIKNLIGNLEGEIEYGEVDLQLKSRTKIKTLNGKYSPMTITLDRMYSNSLQLMCDRCSVNVSDELKSKRDINTEGDLLIINKGAKDGGSINSIIEDITIK